jgi:hypothetical protein
MQRTLQAIYQSTLQKMKKTSDNATRVCARLSIDDAGRLNQIAKAENKPVTDIIRTMIRRYITEASAIGESAAIIFERNGFVGCATATSKLSASQKRILTRSIAEKTGYK